MKLSTRGRYATRAMLDLAQHHSKGSVLLRDIAQRQQISQKYLKLLMAPLKAAGLVRTVRGINGGFTLTRQPHDIRLFDIVQAMEGSIAPVDCVDNPEFCPRANICVMCDIWAEMKKAMNSILKSTTLQDLVNKQSLKEAVIS